MFSTASAERALQGQVNHGVQQAEHRPRRAQNGPARGGGARWRTPRARTRCPSRGEPEHEDRRGRAVPPGPVRPEEQAADTAERGLETQHADHIDRRRPRRRGRRTGAHAPSPETAPAGQSPGIPPPAGRSTSAFLLQFVSADQLARGGSGAWGGCPAAARRCWAMPNVVNLRTPASDRGWLHCATGRWSPACCAGPATIRRGAGTGWRGR